MEYAIHLLALFIALNFLLKVGFYPRWGMCQMLCLLG